MSRSARWLWLAVALAVPWSASGMTPNLDHALLTGGYDDQETMVYRLLAATRPELLPLDLQDAAFEDIDRINDSGTWACATPLIQKRWT